MSNNPTHRDRNRNYDTTTDSSSRRGDYGDGSRRHRDDDDDERYRSHRSAMSTISTAPPRSDHHYRDGEYREERRDKPRDQHDHKKSDHYHSSSSYSSSREKDRERDRDDHQDRGYEEKSREERRKDRYDSDKIKHRDDDGDDRQRRRDDKYRDYDKYYDERSSHHQRDHHDRHRSHRHDDDREQDKPPSSSSRHDDREERERRDKYDHHHREEKSSRRDREDKYYDREKDYSSSHDKKAYKSDHHRETGPRSYEEYTREREERNNRESRMTRGAGDGEEKRRESKKEDKEKRSHHHDDYKKDRKSSHRTEQRGGGGDNDEHYDAYFDTRERYDKTRSRGGGDDDDDHHHKKDKKASRRRHDDDFGGGGGSESDDDNYSKRDKKDSNKKDSKKEKKRDLSSTSEYGQHIILKNRQLKVLPLPIHVFGYTNDENPFNDPKLDAVFHWDRRDKLYLDKGKHVPIRDAQFLLHQAEQNKKHILLVQKRRKQMLEQREEQEMMMEQMSRDVETSKGQDLELEQARSALLLYYKQCEIRTLTRTELPIHCFLKFVLFRLKITNFDVLRRIGISSADSRIEHHKHNTFITEYLEIDHLVNINELINHLEFDDVLHLYVDVLYIIDITIKTLAFQVKKQKQREEQQRSSNNNNNRGEYYNNNNNQQQQETQQEMLQRLAMSYGNNSSGNNGGGGATTINDHDIIVTQGDLEFWECLSLLIQRQIDIKYLMKLGFSYEYSYYIILSANNQILFNFTDLKNHYRLYMNDVVNVMIASTEAIYKEQLTKYQAQLEKLQKNEGLKKKNNDPKNNNGNNDDDDDDEDNNNLNNERFYHNLSCISSATKYIDLNEGDEKQLAPQFKELLIEDRAEFLANRIANNNNNTNAAMYSVDVVEEQKRHMTEREQFNQYQQRAKGITQDPTTTAAAANLLNQFSDSPNINSKIQNLLKQNNNNNNSNSNNNLTKQDIMKLKKLYSQQSLLQRCVPVVWRFETAASIPITAVKTVYRQLYECTDPKHSNNNNNTTTTTTTTTTTMTSLIKQQDNWLTYSDDPKTSVIMTLSEVKRIKERAWGFMEEAKALCGGGIKYQMKEFSMPPQPTTDLSSAIGSDSYDDGGDNNNNNSNNNNVKTEQQQHNSTTTSPSSSLVVVKQENVTDNNNNHNGNNNNNNNNNNLKDEQAKLDAMSNYHLWSNLRNEMRFVEARSKLQLYYRRLMLLRTQQLQQEEQYMLSRREQQQPELEGSDETVIYDREEQLAREKQKALDMQLFQGYDVEDGADEVTLAAIEEDPEQGEQEESDKQNAVMNDDINDKQTEHDLSGDGDSGDANDINVEVKPLDLKQLLNDYHYKEQTLKEQHQYTGVSQHDALRDYFKQLIVEQRAQHLTQQQNDIEKNKELKLKLREQQQQQNASSSSSSTNNITLTKEQQQLKQQLDKRLQLRKPRYISKIKTGFSWSKYNRTHYDKSNPPPKAVQGYRFHIFYPDLLDPTITPTYELIIDKKDPDYCLLRFKAQLQYEPLTFKIVRGEWERNNHRGFRSFFQNGVLTLAFNFKRVGYRR